MRMKYIYTFFISMALLLSTCFSFADDWPIYKGNIYFTGNNDEVIVKNNKLKWLFQAGERVYNPVVSDGDVFFIDQTAKIYSLDQERGTLNWLTDTRKISAQFKALSRSAGKIKYPLITGDMLLVSDPIAIYSFNKMNGNVIWARTGLRMDDTKPQGLSGRTYTTIVDGIYSDPIISDQMIYYGTRNMFISRETRNGHLKWDNRDIKSYSGFPTFYDEYIITQSMNYQTNRYTIHCLNADDGRELWSKLIPKPIKIFPPVVYKRKIFIPSGSSIYCLDLKSGNLLWQKDYGKIITSHPSFTDRSVIFAADNSTILITSPDNGSVFQSINIGPRTSPHFVLVRDQLYVAYNRYTKSGSVETARGYARAVDISNGSTIWEYTAPFPGGISQPVAANGILFFPAGEYLYAIGEEYYGGNRLSGPGITTLPSDDSGKNKAPLVTPENSKKVKDTSPEEEPVKTRPLDLKITDENGNGLPAQVEIKKRKDGRVVYHDVARINRDGKIQVPEGDNVELLVDSDGFVPKKVIVNGKDNDKTVTLDRIEQGKGFVVDNILFNFDKWYLKKESLDILDKLVIIMKRNTGLKVEVRGYTDSTGEKAYNQKLSEKRADAVIEYMIKNGISPERLNAVGLGEANPISSNNTLEGRRKNRRTEFFFLK